MNEAYEFPVLEVFDNDGNRIPIPGFAIPYVLTNEDKATIVQSVVESIGVPVFGTIGDDKTITLNENLPDGVYTIRYLTDDGYAEIGTITVGNVIPDGPNEPDAPQEPTAPDTTIVWERGTKIDYENNGAEVEGQTTYSASNYIEIVDGFKYTLSKVDTSGSGSADVSLRVVYYSAYDPATDTGTYLSISDTYMSSHAATSVEVPMVDGAKYFRLRLYFDVARLDDSYFTLSAEAVS